MFEKRFRIILFPTYRDIFYTMYLTLERFLYPSIISRYVLIKISFSNNNESLYYLQSKSIIVQIIIKHLFINLKNGEIIIQR